MRNLDNTPPYMKRVFWHNKENWYWLRVPHVEWFVKEQNKKAKEWTKNDCGTIF